MAENQYVIFQVGQETFGISIAKVWEIITPQTITKIPYTSGFIEGVINLRGKVIPIIDLRKRFCLPVGEQTQSERIMVVEIKGNTLGMIVEGVSEVLQINSEAVESVSPELTEIDSTYLEGIAKLEDRLIILLDVNEVLSHRERLVLDELELPKRSLGNA